MTRYDPVYTLSALALAELTKQLPGANPCFLQQRNQLPEKLTLHSIYFHLTLRAPSAATKTPQKTFKRTTANERMAEYDSTPDSLSNILQLSENWEETLLRPSSHINIESTDSESIGH